MPKLHTDSAAHTNRVKPRSSRSEARSRSGEVAIVCDALELQSLRTRGANACRATHLQYLLLMILVAAFPSATLAANYCVRDIPAATYREFAPARPETLRTDQATAVDLPDIGVTALLDRSRVSFRDNGGGTYVVAELNPGDDYGALRHVEPLEDNWLYVPGDQYQNVVHLQRTGTGRWETDRIVSLREKSEAPSGAVFARLLHAFQLDDEAFDHDALARDHIDAVVRIEGPIIYSAALKRLFLPAMLGEFRQGAFGALGAPAHNYIGDIPRLKTAFFRSDDGEIYSYDGTSLSPVANGRIIPFIVRENVIEQGFLTDVPALGRSFYAIRSGVYELVKGALGFELRNLNLPPEPVDPPDFADYFFTRLLTTPDGGDIAIFTRGNIHLLSTLKGIYPRRVPSQQINTTGANPPIFVPQLNGIAFSTGGSYVPADRTEYFHVLSDCAASGASTLQ